MDNLKNMKTFLTDKWNKTGFISKSGTEIHWRMSMQSQEMNKFIVAKHLQNLVNTFGLDVVQETAKVLKEDLERQNVIEDSIG